MLLSRDPLFVLFCLLCFLLLLQYFCAHESCLNTHKKLLGIIRL